MNNDHVLGVQGIRMFLVFGDMFGLQMPHERYSKRSVNANPPALALICSAKSVSIPDMRLFDALQRGQTT